MMVESFEKKLKVVIRENNEEIFCFIEDNIMSFFSTPDIKIYYNIIKNVDFNMTEKTMPKLIVAWMAFVCGDNKNLFLYMNCIDESDLSNEYESSMYYSLKAMIEYMKSSDKGLYYAKLSLDILKNEDFYVANAKLTYGQLLSNSNKFRLATEMFRDAYKIFFELDLQFLAIVSVVNEMLNRYKLGEFLYVVDKCKELLLMSGSYKGEMNNYYKAVNLPLGMCYYELNKPNLAIKYLISAKETIDKFELFHMHGFIELYLFKSYYIQGNIEGMKTIYEDVKEKFGHMSYRQTDILIGMFNIFLNNNDELLQLDLENFELDYIENKGNSHSIIVDSLFLLQTKKLTEIITIDDLKIKLDRLRYIGLVPLIQVTQLQLAELYYMEEKSEEAIVMLKEAINIYKEFKIYASFYSMPFQSIGLIKDFNKKFYNLLSKNISFKQKQKGMLKEPLLSTREKEIIELIAKGKTNKQLSQDLYISLGTVKWHINNIFSKLEVNNRVQAIEKAKKLKEI